MPLLIWRPKPFVSSHLHLLVSIWMLCCGAARVVAAPTTQPADPVRIADSQVLAERTIGQAVFKLHKVTMQAERRAPTANELQLIGPEIRAAILDKPRTRFDAASGDVLFCLTRQDGDRVQPECIAIATFLEGDAVPRFKYRAEIADGPEGLTVVLAALMTNHVEIALLQTSPRAESRGAFPEFLKDVDRARLKSHGVAGTLSVSANRPVQVIDGLSVVTANGGVSISLRSQHQDIGTIRFDCQRKEWQIPKALRVIAAATRPSSGDQ